MSETRARWKTILEAIVWIAVLGYAGYQLWPQIAAALGVGGHSRPAPSEVTVRTFEGERVRIGELRGQVVLVNFWATWCPPCRLEMPGFQDVYEEHRERGFTVLGLTTESAPREEIRPFLAEHGVTYPVARATRDVERAFGGVTALPTSYLIDRQGRIRRTVRGFFAEVALRRAVERLLDEESRGASGQAPEKGGPVGALARLTPRQREVLQLVAEGYTSREIAEKLGLSQKTIEFHRRNIRDRLEIEDLAGLVRFAVRTDLVPPDA